MKSVISIAASVIALLPSVFADVWDPEILFPHTGTSWIAGQHHNVTWAVDPPPEITNPIGQIILRSDFGAPNPFGPVTLASGFDLHEGSHVIQVPSDAPARSDYVIVLTGDSGNASPQFTILSPITCPAPPS